MLNKGEENVEPYTFNPKVPFNPRQVWEIARSSHVDSLIYSLNYFIKVNKESPVYHDLFAFALISELIEEGNLITAKELFNFYKTEKVPIVNRFISLSKFSVMMYKKDYAKRCLTNLLKIAPDNIEAKEQLEMVKN